jgi:hypothetical protein
MNAEFYPENLKSREHLEDLGVGKGKVAHVLNKAPRKEDVLGEWRYSSTHSCSRHLMEVSVQLHASAALPSGKEPPVRI